MPAGEVRNKINENPVEIRTKRSKEHEDGDKGNIVVEIVDKPEPINLVDKGELEKTKVNRTSTYHQAIGKPIQNDVRDGTEDVDEVSILLRYEGVRATRVIARVNESHFVEFSLCCNAESP